MEKNKHKKLILKLELSKKFLAVCFGYLLLITIGCEEKNLPPSSKQTSTPSPGVVAPSPGVVAPSPGVVAHLPGVVAPSPGVVAHLPGVVAPLPGVVAPLPGVVAPLPGVVAPLPGVVAPSPETGNNQNLKPKYPSGNTLDIEFLGIKQYEDAFYPALKIKASPANHGDIAYLVCAFIAREDGGVYSEDGSLIADIKNHEIVDDNLLNEDVIKRIKHRDSRYFTSQGKFEGRKWIAVYIYSQKANTAPIHLTRQDLFNTNTIHQGIIKDLENKNALLSYWKQAF